MNLLKPNEAQEKAIETLKGPVILISCPGSGKTTTLVRRIHHLIESGVDPDRILMVTFTNAAADDLKKNAREKFLQEGLISQAAELDSAAIGTVHSIGLLYIKKYWYKLGLIK